MAMMDDYEFYMRWMVCAGEEWDRCENDDARMEWAPWIPLLAGREAVAEPNTVEWFFGDECGFPP